MFHVKDSFHKTYEVLINVCQVISGHSMEKLEIWLNLVATDVSMRKVRYILIYTR